MLTCFIHILIIYEHVFIQYVMTFNEHMLRHISNRILYVGVSERWEPVWRCVYDTDGGRWTCKWIQLCCRHGPFPQKPYQRCKSWRVFRRKVTFNYRLINDLKRFCHTHIVRSTLLWEIWCYTFFITVSSKHFDIEAYPYCG